MRVRFIYRDHDTLLPRRLCAAELAFDDRDAPLAGLWLVGFELWREPWGGIAVTLPCCPLGAPREWRHFEFLRGDPEATARVKAFIVEAYENRGDLWTCPGCRRPNPEPQPPAGSEWTCPVCRTLARARDHESPILDTLQTLDRPLPPPLRRVARRWPRPQR